MRLKLNLDVIRKKLAVKKQSLTKNLLGSCNDFFASCCNCCNDYGCCAGDLGLLLPATGTLSGGGISVPMTQSFPNATVYGGMSSTHPCDSTNPVGAQSYVLGCHIDYGPTAPAPTWILNGARYANVIMTFAGTCDNFTLTAPGYDGGCTLTFTAP